MNAEQILKSDDFQRCEQFHGHVCPGLAIGYLVSKAGLSWLEQNRSVDEEIVAVVENDACCVDALQVLTGCTFGKGNFMFEDNGKMVFTFLSRESGKGVRFSLKPDILTPSPRHLELMDKMHDGTISEPEQNEMKKLHQQRTMDILELGAEKIFQVEPVEKPIPSRAKVEPSTPCQRCGEPTMPSRMVDGGGGQICRPCDKK